MQALRSSCLNKSGRKLPTGLNDKIYSWCPRPKILVETTVLEKFKKCFFFIFIETSLEKVVVQYPNILKFL